LSVCGLALYITLNCKYCSILFCLVHLLDVLRDGVLIKKERNKENKKPAKAVVQNGVEIDQV
jgi:predicted nucleic acid binding AN1-type Zn finger protein